MLIDVLCMHYVLYSDIWYFVLSDSATVQDLIGLSFWKYNEGRKEPIKFVSHNVVQAYLFIAT